MSSIDCPKQTAGPCQTLEQLPSVRPGFRPPATSCQRVISAENNRAGTERESIIVKILIAGAAFAAVLAASAPAYSADPIKIGLSGPFTGGSASMGVSMRDGAKLAAAEINKAGGVLGRPLQLIERDEEAKNEMGVQVSQELINKEQVAATLGYINTGVALASQRFYQEAEIPVINNVATGTLISKQFVPPDYKNNYVFRTSANDIIPKAA